MCVLYITCAHISNKGRQNRSYRAAECMYRVLTRDSIIYECKFISSLPLSIFLKYLGYLSCVRISRQNCNFLIAKDRKTFKNHFKIIKVKTKKYLKLISTI